MKSLRFKIYLGLAIILILLLSLSVNSHYSIKNSNQNIDAIVSDELPFLINNEKLILNIAQRLAVLRGYLLNGEEQYKDDFIQLTKDSQQIEAELLELDDENLTSLIQKSISWSGLIQTQIIELYERGDKDLALQFLEIEAGPLGEELMQEINDFTSANQENILSQGRNVMVSNERISTLNFYVSIIAVIVGVAVAFIIPRIIVNPILKVVGRVEQVAEGKLNDENIEINAKDEIGKLATSVNKMVLNLRNLITKTNSIVNYVTDSAKKLSVSSEETRKATEQIASSIQEVATGSEVQVKNTDASNQQGKDISNKVMEIEENINEVVTFSIDTTKKAETGTKVVDNTKKQMEVISSRTTELSEIMNSLHEKSDKIGNIIEMISGISEQTNVLALNAVIEAARANEEGKAFAVVASEVGVLAQKSNESAKLIAQLIEGIQTDIEKTVAATEGTSSAVEDGILLVGEAGVEFNNITQSVKNVQVQIENASLSVKEIAESVQQLVSTNMENAKIASINSDHTQNIAASAQEQHALMEEIAVSANHLLSIAEELQSNLKIFRV